MTAARDWTLNFSVGSCQTGGEREGINYNCFDTVRWSNVFGWEESPSDDTPPKPSENNNPSQRPRYSPNHFSRALDIVRSILDDQPLNHPVSPSGELYRAIERYHRGVDRVAESTRRSSPPNTSAADSNANTIPPTNNNNTDSSFNPLRHQPYIPLSRAVRFGAIANHLGASSDTTMSGNNNPNSRRSNTSAGQDPREPRFEPPSLPPLRFSGSDSRRSSNLSNRDRLENHSSFRLRSAFSNISSFIRSDSNRSQSLDQDRDRDRTRYRTDIYDLSLPLPLGLSLNEYSYTNDLNPSTINPAIISPPAPEDYHNDYRSIKRRKLDNEAQTSNEGFRYGYYGQVEPGELKMELVSCDGGMYEGEHVYAAENILKDDKSVYCTKGNRCNILLRHQGSSVFTLKELVIKAPGTDFDAPVRNGFVFVSMANDDILSRTAKYQIQYKTSTRDDSRERQPPQNERARGLPSSYHPLTEANFSSILMGSESDQRYMHHRRRPYTLSEGLGLDDEENDDENELRLPREGEREAQIPDEFNLEGSEFNVTTECGDDDEEAGMGRMRNRRAPNRIGSLPFESDSDDPRNPFSYGSFEDIARWRRRERLRRQESGGVSGGESSSFAEAAEEHQQALQEAVRAVGGALLQPLAKFSIDKDKNRCTIKFDPPVSARYLLLKIWNPTHDASSNIDIKAVVVKGFSGPRFFPAIELR
ncbi:hypothetical protein MKZ38_002156 [Zalerion maritima]|uniref:Uncharacterized protein n=1 Tax=Zalerion maritima TaxID=339359 RepID=A0AAD5RQM9_9PEZI|nr:hypothetical protein MKZ38_002156 [Zalerion maritima]